MNHQKIYESVIQKAKSENRIKLKKNHQNYIYYENHHILPKCLSGNNDSNNLVLLTAKEHYICHKLLTYIYNVNRKIAQAFFRMTFDKKGKHNISSRDYAYARELANLIPVSSETREKQSKTRKGKITWMKDKHHTKESIQLIKEARKKQIPWNKNKHNCQNAWNKELKMSKEFCNKMSKIQIGKKHSEEQNKNHSKKMRGKSLKVNNMKKECEYCGIITTPGNYGRWHGYKCKNKY